MSDDLPNPSSSQAAPSGNMSRFYAGAWWVALLLITEMLPILTMIMAHKVADTGESLRDVLGYTTTSLVAVSLLAAVLIEVTVSESYKGFTQVEFLILMVGGAAAVLIFGTLIMVDISAEFSPEMLTVEEATVWRLEIGMVLCMLVAAGYYKARVGG